MNKGTSYGHANSALNAPTLSGDALAIYRAIAAGTPITITRTHFTPEDLRLVAERLACDESAAHLRSLGVRALVTESPQDDPERRDLYVSASVSIYLDDHVPRWLNSEATNRVAQRIESGLSPLEAVDRTLAQCDRPVMSEHALRELEREADSAERRSMRGCERSERE